MNKSKNYYGSIDGIRAICFLLVFLFHCNVNGFEFGWAGVIVFFVISGFLITEILINSKQSHSYFKKFYLRRILRIFPTYYVVVIGAICIFIFLNRTIPNDLIYHITYMQNIFWVHSNYVSDLQPLLAHTWTLAIEEQFYLLWPLIIWLIPTKHLHRLCAAIIAFGIIFRILMVILNYKYAASILLFSQIDTLALGAGLACYKKGIIKNKLADFLFRNSMIIGFCGIIIIMIYNSITNNLSFLITYTLFKTPSGYLGNPFTAQIYFFLALFSIGLIQKCYTNSGLFNKLFSNKYLIHIGKLSYGLYLYHWPLLVIMRKVLPGLSDILFVPILFTVTYIVSFLSYYTIEKFFRNLKNKFA